MRIYFLSLRKSTHITIVNWKLISIIFNNISHTIISNGNIWFFFLWKKCILTHFSREQNNSVISFFVRLSEILFSMKIRIHANTYSIGGKEKESVDLVGTPVFRWEKIFKHQNPDWILFEWHNSKKKQHILDFKPVKLFYQFSKIFVLM